MGRRATTALIVVDMQNAYLSKGGYLDLVGFDVSTSAPVIDKAAGGLAAARAAGMVIFICRTGSPLCGQRPGGRRHRSGTSRMR